MIFSTPQASSGAASQPKPINLLAMVGAMAAARLRGTRGSGHGLAPEYHYQTSCSGRASDSAGPRMDGARYTDKADAVHTDAGATAVKLEAAFL